MGTTVEDLREWFNRGDEENATHMIVVCDTFDHEDYPVYVKKGESVHDKIKYYQSAEMQRIMEVYTYKKTFQQQSGGRVWNTD